MNGSGQFLPGHALFFGSNDIAGKNRQHRTVHGHGDRHHIQGNLIEKYFHVFHRIDGHTGFADITDHPGMIGIIPPMGGKIEGDRKPFLTGCKAFSIKGIGFLGRGKTGILANRPRPAGIHGAPNPSRKRRKARQGI